MATLLFEAWRDLDGRGLMFWSVSERSDADRERLWPNAQFLYSLRASTTDEAMQAHYDRQGWGQHQPSGYGDDVFTDERSLEQARYLAKRVSPAG